jgi:hypothetical protein
MLQVPSTRVVKSPKRRAPHRATFAMGGTGGAVAERARREGSCPGPAAARVYPPRSPAEATGRVPVNIHSAFFFFPKWGASSQFLQHTHYADPVDL